MEYCESTLVDIYRKNITDENLILSYIHQIAEACHYLHTEKLFVHGDLKLENILIKDGTIKLADFGVSLRLASTTPEMIENDRCGVKIDCWALGCILYQLLGGKLAFVGKTKEEIRQNILNGNYKKSLNVSQSAINLLKRLLEPNANSRYSMNDVLNSSSAKEEPQLE
ncbi:hypothetical protein LAZ67_6000928 [Cordylochernes scorpioides]|uniref:Protein kinase domain-containing protein n=1 Tax=Cordylochernes scorpioides TaxID=51811 RepID=A0ABY6KLZ0_9ARAC|nr:hypothetical protein LAZ67_6000928 [Cordylochernes scorpioides]